MGHRIAGWIGVFLVASLCYAGVAQAQWVFLGRKAMGVVNRLVSPALEKQGQGYDVATVLLEADADKVYGTAIDLLKGNPNFRITHRDDSSRTVEFTDGNTLVGLKVSRLEDKVSQLLIGSAPGVWDKIMADIRNMPREIALSLIKEQFRNDPLPALRLYHGPKLAIVTPANDMPYSLHHLLPDLPYTVMTGTGHWLQLDKPEEFNRILDEFLGRVDIRK